jgi:hypothetical protein
MQGYRDCTAPLHDPALRQPPTTLRLLTHLWSRRGHHCTSLLRCQSPRSKHTPHQHDGIEGFRAVLPRLNCASARPCPEAASNNFAAFNSSLATPRPSAYINPAMPITSARIMCKSRYKQYGWSRAVPRLNCASLFPWADAASHHFTAFDSSLATPRPSSYMSPAINQRRFQLKSYLCLDINKKMAIPRANCALACPNAAADSNNRAASFASPLRRRVTPTRGIGEVRPRRFAQCTYRA